MAVSDSSCLLDTNILLRLAKRDSPEFSSIREALRLLDRENNRLCYTSQNLVEFWNVSTRPVEKNDHGLSIKVADQAARHIENAFQLLPDAEQIHAEWRRLVIVYAVSGVQVHDARLVAAMKVHGIPHLLTLNDRDFIRHREVVALHPGQVAGRR